MSVSLTGASARTFRSLRRHRNYRLFFAGQIVSVSGTWIQNVAQAWFVLALTHSPVVVGVLAACQFGPYAILGLVGGVFADRLDQRRALIVTQSAFTLSAATLAGLAISGHAAVWEVFLLAGVNGVVTVVDTPVRQAFTIQMVGRDELPNAIALNSSLFNASRAIGPGIGGVLIAVAGVGVCFLVNALSFLAVIGALLLMRREELFGVRREGRRPTLVRGMGEGLQYAWRTPTIRVVLVMMLVISTIGINFNVLLPVLAGRTLHGGPQVYGLLSAAFGIGALFGALTSATLARASARVLLLGASAFAAGELVLAPLNLLWAAATVLVAVGFSFSLYASQSNSALQLTVPDRLRGRILSLYGYVFFGTAPLGALLAGWLAQAGGTSLAFLVAGLAAVAAIAYGSLDIRRRRARGPVRSVA